MCSILLNAFCCCCLQTTSLASKVASKSIKLSKINRLCFNKHFICVFLTYNDTMGGFIYWFIFKISELSKF